MRILVVEDGAAIRNQVAERLRNDGFVVDTAGDGREGMNCATEYPINLAVVDLGLPEMDGIELTEHIHAEDHDRDSNVIVTTCPYPHKVDQRAPTVWQPTGYILDLPWSVSSWRCGNRLRHTCWF